VPLLNALRFAFGTTELFANEPQIHPPSEKRRSHQAPPLLVLPAA
jgi:hypothetical protein